MMMTERGRAAPAAGGSVRADFDTILTAVVPELAWWVQAVAFDAETGRLDVVPDLPAAGTQLRRSAPKLVTAANERVRGANVRALHVLTPAPEKGQPATAAEPAPQPTDPAAPTQRLDPPDGYREAVAAHRATRQHTRPEVQAAAERQLRDRPRPRWRSRPPAGRGGAGRALRASGEVSGGGDDCGWPRAAAVSWVRWSLLPLTATAATAFCSSASYSLFPAATAVAASGAAAATMGGAWA